jgi:hypothetical protein
MMDVAGLRLGGTPASAGVPATPSMGLDKNFTVQLSGSSLLQAGDLHVFSALYDDLPGAWRAGPRFSVAEVNNPTLGGKQTLFLPQVRADWTNRRSVFEATAGYQIQTQQSIQQSGLLPAQSTTSALDQRSLYISVAYRLRF